MKILQLCKKFPYPLKDGESIAVTTLCRALRELGSEVTLLSMNTTKHYCDLTQLPKSYDHYQAIHTVDLDNRLKPWDALMNLFSKESYHISRFVSADFSARLVALLEETRFDVIHLETVYLAPYIPVIARYTDAPIVMRAHNVEHEIWERVATNSRFLPKKWYLQYLTRKLRTYELNCLAGYDLLAAITKRDLDLFRQLGYKNSAIVTPVGIEGNAYIPDYQSFERKPSIGFIGSLDWMPNQEGLAWFLDEVWARVGKKYPDLELHIAGRHTPKELLELSIPNVIVHGEVPDAKEFINQHSMMLVPLLSGSGIRVKILEGMALGKVVITTSVGMEGIEAENGKEIMVADSADAFVDCIELCMQNSDKLEQIGRRARQLIEREFDNLEIAERLLEQYTRLLKQDKNTRAFSVPK